MRAYIDEIRNSVFEEYALRQTSSLLPTLFSFGGTPTLWTPDQCSGRMDSTICLIRPTTWKTILRKQIFLQMACKAQEDLLAKFDFTEEGNHDLLDKVLDLMLLLPSMFLSNEESSEYAKLYHPYKWDDFKALRRNCL